MINAFVVFETFAKYQNKDIAKGQENYMKNHFKFYGITSPQRKTIQKPWLLKTALPTKDIAIEIAIELYQNPHRECHYFAIELIEKFSKNFAIEDINHLEYLIINQSWWDTVDLIASTLVGRYFLTYPEQRQSFINKWLSSNHLWLQRTAVLFQLKYKKQLDQEILIEIIKHLSGSKEFFINKAIGWILREYSKTNPFWVKNFMATNQLHPLSIREGSKYLG